MTDKLKECIGVPKWIIIMFATLLISLFTTGWVKIENLREDITVEKTSRIYIEKMLSQIDKKIDRIDVRLGNLENK